MCDRRYSRWIAVTYRLESHSAFPFDMVSVNCQCRCSPSGEAQQRRSLTCPIASRAVEASFWRVSPRDPCSSAYHRRSPAAAPPPKIKPTDLSHQPPPPKAAPTPHFPPPTPPTRPPISPTPT